MSKQFLNKNKSWLEDAKELYAVAIPLVSTLLAQYGITVVDAIMMGRLGEVEFAAGTLGETVLFSVLIFFTGILSAVGVYIARFYGGGEEEKISQALYHGLFLALAISIPGIVIMYAASPFFLYIGLDPNLTVVTHKYLSAVAWCLPPAFCFVVLREMLASFSKAHIVMLISFCAIPLNALTNYILMYGKLGFPALGISGIGYATVFTESAMFLALAYYIFQQESVAKYFKSKIKFNFSIFGSLLKLGLPVAILMILEHGLFAVSAVLMGYFGVVALAAHQIAFQSISVSFMIPLGISQASALLISRALGAKAFGSLKHFVYIGLGTGLLFAFCAAMIFLLFPHGLVDIFIGKHVKINETLLTLTTHFLWIAVIFHFFDAAQAICLGILRGFKDTVIPLLLGLFGYWLAGLGSGYVLAFKFNWSGVGLWWGLAVGIMAAATMLMIRVHYQLRRATSEKRNYY